MNVGGLRIKMLTILRWTNQTINSIAANVIGGKAYRQLTTKFITVVFVKILVKGIKKEYQWY